MGGRNKKIRKVGGRNLRICRAGCKLDHQNWEGCNAAIQHPGCSGSEREKEGDSPTDMLASVVLFGEDVEGLGKDPFYF